jgi:hypothetical protein
MLLPRKGRQPSQVRRPPIARYEKLIQDLMNSQFTLERGHRDPLAVAIFAVCAVIQFLDADEAVVDSGITNPLSVIANALHDYRRGGRPPIFFDRPKAAGRPTDQMFDAVKAAAAMGVEVLLPLKVTRDQAGKYVAAEARRLGFRRPDGKDITGRTVLGWRDEIETSKSEIGAEVFKELKAAKATKAPIGDLTRAVQRSIPLTEEVESARQHVR